MSENRKRMLLGEELKLTAESHQLDGLSIAATLDSLINIAWKHVAEIAREEMTEATEVIKEFATINSISPADFLKLSEGLNDLETVWNDRHPNEQVA